MKTVTVYVSGGVVQSVDVPEGVQVLVRDYDCDDEDRITGHDEGKPFVEGTHRHPNERFQPGEKGNFVTVRDQEGDCWDVGVDQVSFSEDD